MLIRLWPRNTALSYHVIFAFPDVHLPRWTRSPHCEESGQIGGCCWCPWLPSCPTCQRPASPLASLSTSPSSLASLPWWSASSSATSASSPPSSRRSSSPNWSGDQRERPEISTHLLPTAGTLVRRRQSWSVCPLSWSSWSGTGSALPSGEFGPPVIIHLFFSFSNVWCL